MTWALVSRWYTSQKDTGYRNLRAALPLRITTPRQYSLSQNLSFSHAYQDASADIVVSHLLVQLVGTPWSFLAPLILSAIGRVAKNAAELRSGHCSAGAIKPGHHNPREMQNQIVEHSRKPAQAVNLKPSSEVLPIKI